MTRWLTRRRSLAPCELASNLPEQLLGGERSRHLPGGLASLAGFEREAERGQRSAERLRRARGGTLEHLGGEAHLHGLFARVSHRETAAETVFLAHHGGQARDQHEVLGGTHRGRAAAEEIARRAGHGHDPERGQGIVQGHLDARLALLVERDPAFPKEQGVEQLARRLPAAAPAVGQGLAAVVAFADHLHLGGRGLDLDPAPTHHRLQEVPAIVRHQFQEALIDGGQGDFPARRQRPAIRALHPDDRPGPCPAPGNSPGPP